VQGGGGLKRDPWLKVELKLKIIIIIAIPLSNTTEKSIK